ncbi:MAG: hypothetical protein SPJ13_05415 [Bacteroidales bacterium]|nr:hypothetical protein [Bacteroidales bacterium]
MNVCRGMRHRHAPLRDYGKTVGAILLLLTFSVLGYAQDANKMLTPLQMREDVDSLYAWYKETHPNPFAVLDEEAFDRTIDSLKNSLDRDKTKAQFYTTIVGLQRFFDLHSRIGYSKKMMSKLDAYFQLPRFEERDGKVYIRLDTARYEVAACQRGNAVADRGIFSGKQQYLGALQEPQFL